MAIPFEEVQRAQQAVPRTPKSSLSGLGTGKEGEARLVRGGEHGWAPEAGDWPLPFPDKAGDSAKSSVNGRPGWASSTAL